MAQLAYKNMTTTNPKEIKDILSEYGIVYENWGVKDVPLLDKEAVLKAYESEVELLKKTRDYVTQDIVALDPDMQNLDAILQKFDKEHHHTDDEVRFTVAGEGVFEINISEDERVKFTAEPGDLIVIPAFRRHLFYLTEKKQIRCIRLFKDISGWEALYQIPAAQAAEPGLFYGC